MKRLWCLLWICLGICTFELCCVCSYESIEDLSDFGGNVEKMVLDNGLQVMLISSPNLEQSSCALSVEVGSWDDPKQHPGMAHFVEHLLFLGTQAYPEESEFIQYVRDRAGGCNAFTERDRTIYGFSIGKESGDLEEALDRFSHFFIDPLFTDSAIEREIHAVNHEFEDAKTNELYMIWRLFKQIGNQEHPNAQFSFGNLESLDHIRRKDMVEWFEQQYHPGRMRLVILSPKPIEELSKMVCRLFSRIRIQAPVSKKTPVGSLSSSLQKGNITHIRSSFNERVLSLVWEVPPFFLKEDKVEILVLLEKLMNYSCVHGLAELLREEELAFDARAIFSKVAKEYGLFEIDIFLTKKGVFEYESVIEKCFQSLKFLLDTSTPQYILDAFKGKDRDFQYYEEYEWAMEIAGELLDVELDAYPEQELLPDEVALSFLLRLIRHLNPAHCLYFLMAPARESDVVHSELEKWMGLNYAVRKIPMDKIYNWTTASADLRTTFVQEQEDQRMQITEVGDREPIFIVNDPRAEICLIQTQDENTIGMFLCFSTPALGVSLSDYAKGVLFGKLLEDRMGEVFGQDEFLWDIVVERGDLCLFLSVPKQGAKDFLSRFFQVFKGLHSSAEEFEQTREWFLSHYPGDPDPLIYAHQIFDLSLLEGSYTDMELYRGLQELTYEEYDSFQRRRLEEAFVDGVFMGHIHEQEAQMIWSRISSILAYEPYVDKVQREGLTFPQEPVVLTHQTHHRANALLVVLATSAMDAHAKAAHRVLSLALESAFFKELRTNQQTAYHLYSWSECVQERIVHGFALQSSSYQPKDLLVRVEGFFEEFISNIELYLPPQRALLIQETLVHALEKQLHENISIQEEIHALQDLRYEEIVRAAREVLSAQNQSKVIVFVEGDLTCQPVQ